MKVVNFDFDSEQHCSMCGKKLEEGYRPYPHTQVEYDELVKFLKQSSEEWIICEDCLHREFSEKFHITRVLTAGGERVRICEEILSRYYLVRVHGVGALME